MAAVDPPSPDPPSPEDDPVTDWWCLCACNCCTDCTTCPDRQHEEDAAPAKGHSPPLDGGCGCPCGCCVRCPQCSAKRLRRPSENEDHSAVPRQSHGSQAEVDQLAQHFASSAAIEDEEGHEDGSDVKEQTDEKPSLGPHHQNACRMLMLMGLSHLTAEDLVLMQEKLTEMTKIQLEPFPIKSYLDAKKHQNPLKRVGKYSTGVAFWSSCRTEIQLGNPEVTDVHERFARAYQDIVGDPDRDIVGSQDELSDAQFDHLAFELMRIIKCITSHDDVLSFNIGVVKNQSTLHSALRDRMTSGESYVDQGYNVILGLYCFSSGIAARMMSAECQRWALRTPEIKKKFTSPYPYNPRNDAQGQCALYLVLEVR